MPEDQAVILGIDNDPMALRTIARLLRSVHCIVETVDAAEACLGRPRREAPA